MKFIHISILPIALLASACVGGATHEQLEITGRMNDVLEAPPSDDVCQRARNLDAMLSRNPDQASVAGARRTNNATLRTCPPRPAGNRS